MKKQNYSAAPTIIFFLTSVDRLQFLLIWSYKCFHSKCKHAMVDPIYPEWDLLIASIVSSKVML